MSGPNRIEFNVKPFRGLPRLAAPAGILVYQEIPFEKDHENTLNFLLFNSQTDNIKTEFIW